MGYGIIKHKLEHVQSWEIRKIHVKLRQIPKHSIWSRAPQLFCTYSLPGILLPWLIEDMYESMKLVLMK